MKKLILIVTALCFVPTLLKAQQLNSIELLEKSKRKKTTGWVLLGGGVSLIVIGAAIAPKGETFNEQSFKGAVPALIGAVSTLASVPFFLKSGTLKRKARTVAFTGFQNTRLLVGNSTHPVIGLKIRF
ncbi:MAG TPA: hypothetical protein PK504_11185 [Ferruginibacter sp.]|nr:hypothetical protein [Ferruginibacter sp.]HRE63933.1 hypothetical protein [Ferruginibacter sp.]